MSDQEKSEEVARLERLNGELQDSLGRCRELLRECREKLAANGNDRERPKRMKAR
jgi:hypothetical protein